MKIKMLLDEFKIILVLYVHNYDDLLPITHYFTINVAY